MKYNEKQQILMLETLDIGNVSQHKSTVKAKLCRVGFCIITQYKQITY